MKKKIFKLGNYGTKGNWTKEKLQKAIEKVKEIPVILGHVGDYIKNNIPVTAIPKAGTVTAFSIEGDYLCGDVEYNEYAKGLVKDGAYHSYSVGFSGEALDHLAILGYAQPHIKDLDVAAFSGEDKKEVAYIEFETGSNPDIFTSIGTMNMGQKLEIMKAIVATITAQDRQAARAIAYEFSEAVKEPENAKPKTEAEIEAAVEAKYKEKDRKEKEFSTFLEENKTKILPSMKAIVEFAFKKAQAESELIEFSKEEKCTMLEKIKSDFSKMRSITGEIATSSEFSASKKETIMERAAREAKERQEQINGRLD